MVALFKQEDIKILYGSNEGVIPKIPGFDMLELMRNSSTLPRTYTYTLRHKVQQDMMRPKSKSVLYFIDKIDDIAVDLVEKIEMMMIKDEVLDPSQKF